MGYIIDDTINHKIIANEDIDNFDSIINFLKKF